MGYRVQAFRAVLQELKIKAVSVFAGNFGVDY